MSKYGFDPDELIETKIDLIDKDGFHGVGEASNGGNSDGASDKNVTESSRVIFSINTENNVACIIYLTPKDYPDLFDNLESNILYPYAYALYTGESIDTSEADVVDESGEIRINNKIIGAPLNSYNTLLTKDFINYIGTFNSDYSGIDQDLVPLTVPKDIIKGETVHILLVYNWPGNPLADDNDNYFLQIDGVWTIDPSDFE